MLIMPAQKSLFDLPSFDSVIDSSPLTASANTLVSSAIAIMSQAQENRCELQDTSKSPSLGLLDREQNSCLLIVEAEKLIGIFTKTDVVKLAASQRELNGITIAQVMTKELVTLKRSPNQTILTALSLLHQHQIRHLPILDAEEHLVGLITQASLLQAINPVELLRVVEMLQQQVGEKMTTLEQEISRRQQAEAKLKQITWHNGEFLHTRDVSEQQQTEITLQETLRSLEFQKYALDRVAIVAITDKKGIITYVNEKFCQISKYAKEELIGQTHQIINSGHHPAEFFQELWQTISKGQVWQGEIKNKAKDGSFYWVETTIVPFLDEMGKPFQYLAIRFDISDRKHREVERQQAEIQLREISTALSNAVEGISRLDAQGRYIFINEAYASMIGYTVEEMIGMNWQITVHSEDLEFVTADYQQMLRAGKVELETRGIRKDGSIFYKQLFMISAYNEQQEFIGHYCFAKDISDRKEAEEALQEAHQRIITTWESMTDAYVTLNREWRTIYANAEALKVYQMLGVDLATMWDKTHWELFPQTIGQPLDLEYRRAMADNVAVHFEIEDVATELWFEVHAYPSEVGLGIYFQDITDRKQAEQKIREQAALLDLTTDGIIVRDLESKIQFWNQGAARIYGWQAAETVGQNLRSLLYKEISPQIESAYSTVLETDEWQGELRKITKTGKEVIVASRWTLVRDEAGNPQFILSVDTDITEQKLLEAQFLRAQRMESLGTLAGGVAHDLNNILAPIVGFSQLLPLKLADADEQTKEFFKIIETNAQRGAALVKQILTFSRGVEGERGIVQVRHLITEIKQIVEETFPKAIQLETSAPKNLWTVNGDVNQLHQVLMNLVVNARDAMPQGGKLRITAENCLLDANFARLHLDAQVGSYILITVADTGVGIPAEIIERIFEPFFTTKEVERGTGLGLSTLIGIVKSHGGFVDVVSNTQLQPRGTQFKVFLPASQIAETNLEETESIPQGNGELILVVDDEPAILEVTKATLKAYNYQVLTANNGTEAIALYAQNQNAIKLIIMDIMMPSMDGKTAIRILKSINSEAKIIAVSGLVSDQEIVAEINGNIEAFVAKPCSNNDLLKAINNQLGD
jgi:PAS domain S-box-containing protein